MEFERPVQEEDFLLPADGLREDRAGSLSPPPSQPPTADICELQVSQMQTLGLSPEAQGQGRMLKTGAPQGQSRAGHHD